VYLLDEDANAIITSSTNSQPYTSFERPSPATSSL